MRSTLYYSMFIVTRLEILTSAIYLKLLVGQTLPFYIKWRPGRYPSENLLNVCSLPVTIWIWSVADGELSFPSDHVRTVPRLCAFQLGRCEGLKEKNNSSLYPA